MSNNIHNFNKIPSMPERVLSALAYFSFGIVGIILIIASAIMKIGLKPFVKFNAYQSILIAFIFWGIQLTFDLIVGILQLLNFIPFIGSFLNSFFYFIVFYLMGFPILFGFSLLASALIILLLYLTIMTFKGKTPYLPWISNLVKRFA